MAVKGQPKKTVQLGVRVSPELKQKVEDAAAKQSRPYAQWVRLALEVALAGGADKWAETQLERPELEGDEEELLRSYREADEATARSFLRLIVAAGPWKEMRSHVQSAADLADSHVSVLAASAHAGRGGKKVGGVRTDRGKA